MNQECMKTIKQLFSKEPVNDFKAISNLFTNRSRRSIIRDLEGVGYLSSYNKTGRYYTLSNIPKFNRLGLWFYKDACFSKHGTLKLTTLNLIEGSDKGQTQKELKDLLHVRVHNALLDLVKKEEISRKFYNGTYIYLSKNKKQKDKQFRKRVGSNTCIESLELEPYTIIEVLLEVIRCKEKDTKVIASHLLERGLLINEEQVNEVFERFDLGKKN